MTSILAVPVLIGLIASLLTLLFRPTLRRMATRHLLRRPTETMLVTLGAMLGTAIIASSFLISATVNGSVLNVASTDLGPIDEIVSTADRSEVDLIVSLLGDEPLDFVDGITTMTRTVLPATNLHGTLGNSNTSVHEIDFDDGRAFGQNPAITGLANAGNTPLAGEAIINKPLARELDLEAGDTIVVHAYGQRTELHVTRILDAQGIVGFGGRSLFVAPGTLDAAWNSAGSPENASPTSLVLISNDGAVFGSEKHSAAVTDQIAARLDGEVSYEIDWTKADLIQEAEESGAEFLEIFGSIGSFSIIAGILLLINIFVMLGEERKRELGILRAVGLKRGSLVQGFALEGALYGIAASLTGAIVGIGVGWVITQYAKGFTESPSNDFELLYTVDFGSVISAVVIGLFITLATVWFMSVRISRLNIIRAIKGLNEPKRTKPSLGSLVGGISAIVLGGLLFMMGTSAEAAEPLVIGPPIAFFGIGALARRFISARLVTSVVGVCSIAWGASVFSIGGEAMRDPSIMSFVAQGVVLVAGAIAILTVNDQLWQRLIRRLPGGLALKFGTVYPLAHRFRTAMLLGMFSLVIFTLTFMITFMNLFSSQIPQLRDEIAMGHELFVRSSGTNPITDVELLDVDGVERVNGVARAFVDWEADWTEEGQIDSWPIAGIEAGLLTSSSFELVERDDAYASDEEAFDALLSDTSKILVPEWFLGDNGAPNGGKTVGHNVTLTHPASGDQRNFEVIGTFEDYLYLGPVVSSTVTTEFLGDEAVVRRHYVALDAGANPDELAEVLDASFKNHGVEAESFDAILKAEVDEQKAIMDLLQGYLSMGLLIGIAGLGVVLVRAVRERRREVGTLRAIGVTAQVTRRMFLVESAFIAIQGIVIGAALGLLSAYQTLTNSDAFGQSRLEFAVPWTSLGIMLAIPLAAAILAALGPATQASRIKPAVALRIAD